MFTKLGTVVQADKHLITVKLFDGKYELFFHDLRGFNKSLKVGDSCKVFYKQSILAGVIGYKVHKINKNRGNHENLLRIA